MHIQAYGDVEDRVHSVQMLHWTVLEFKVHGGRRSFRRITRRGHEIGEIYKKYSSDWLQAIWKILSSSPLFFLCSAAASKSPFLGQSQLYFLAVYQFTFLARKELYTALEKLADMWRGIGRYVVSMAWTCVSFSVYIYGLLRYNLKIFHSITWIFEYLHRILNIGKINN